MIDDQSIEEKYGSVSMLKIYSAAMRELIIKKQVFTKDELEQTFNKLATEAEKGLYEDNLIPNRMTLINLSNAKTRDLLSPICSHSEGIDLNGVGMWICKTCRADITPERNEQSSKDQDASCVMTGDSEFDSLAAHRFLSHLIMVLDKYGHGSSMMPPRLTIAIHNAKKFLQSNPTPP